MPLWYWKHKNGHTFLPIHTPNAITSKWSGKWKRFINETLEALLITFPSCSAGSCGLHHTGFGDTRKEVPRRVCEEHRGTQYQAWGSHIPLWALTPGGKDNGLKRHECPAYPGYNVGGCHWVWMGWQSHEGRGTKARNKRDSSGQ